MHHGYVRDLLKISECALSPEWLGGIQIPQVTHQQVLCLHYRFKILFRVGAFNR